MNVIRHTDADFAIRLRQLTASSTLFDPVIESRTRAIIDEVQRRGDAAVLELTEKFDGAKLGVEQLAITRAELIAASVTADPDLRDAINFARKNIERFSRRSLRK